MNRILPVITLYQPWATWIMREWKTIETRTHNRFQCLKGQTILIHAGQKTDYSEVATKNNYLTWEQICYKPEELVNGFILGHVHVSGFKKLDVSHSKSALIDCEHTERWGLFLEKIHCFDVPIPVQGEMGIWYFDHELMQKVKKPKQQLPSLF